MPALDTEADEVNYLQPARKNQRMTVRGNSESRFVLKEMLSAIPMFDNDDKFSNSNRGASRPQ